MNVNNNATTWGAAATATPSTKTSLIQIGPFPTASANWGTVTSASIKEGGTSNIMAYGNLTSSRLVQTGDTVRFSAGNVVVTLQ